MSSIIHVKSGIGNIIVEYSHVKGSASGGKKDWNGTIPEGGELTANWRIGEEEGHVTFQAILDSKPIDSWISSGGKEKQLDSFSITTNAGYEINFTKKSKPNFSWVVTAKPIESVDTGSSHNRIYSQTDVDIEIGPKVN